MFSSAFSFDGRIRRLEYGITFIIYIVVYVLSLSMMDSAGAGSILGLIIFIPLVWFVWAQGAKRCHDIGKSGWWQLIPFYFFVLLFQDGLPGNNEYGENPKGIDGPEKEYYNDNSGTLDGYLKK
jgi:uncharacterized membrane protein YhaH (DUF805 family)